MKLTTREVDVLRLAAAGRRAEQIGKTLGLSSRTVEVHFQKARAKLGATNTTHAVVLALKKRLLELSDIRL